MRVTEGDIKRGRGVKVCQVWQMLSSNVRPALVFFFSSKKTRVAVTHTSDPQQLWGNMLVCVNSCMYVHMCVAYM